MNKLKKNAIARVGSIPVVKARVKLKLSNFASLKWLIKIFQVFLVGGKVQIFCGSTAGKAIEFGKELQERLATSCVGNVILHNMAEVDPEETLTKMSTSEDSVAVFVISTYTGGSPPDSAKEFFNWVEDMANDFR